MEKTAATNNLISDITLLIKNGLSNAHIVISSSASEMERYAAQELNHHLKLVSGVELPIVAKDLKESTSLIIIATLDSLPELRTLYPEDLSWIGDSDGFAIRQNGNRIYIFGTCPEGALNGVYDFIEENMGVLWTRSEEIGLLYDPMPTIAVVKTGYREKSPFAVRGWHLCGNGKSGESHSDPGTEIMMSRNKLNAKFAEFSNQDLWAWQASIGIEPFNLGHNISDWVVTSPSYDSNETEYWSTDAEGNPRLPYDAQVNFWSDKTANTIADSVNAFLEKNDINYVGVGINDTWECTTRPYDQQPFEYAPGQFVNPEEEDYLSTVFFTFMNKIARQLKAAHPNVTLTTYAYFFTEVPPRCDIEDNICVVFAPLKEDVTEPINTTELSPNNKIFQNVENWKQKTRNLAFYNYYGCFTPSEYYERPIAERIQADLQYYAENGFLGLIPEGIVDANNNVWSMNTLTFWLYSKLAWNPYEDIGALIEEFCEKSYGDAAPYMLEYYKLIKQGWDAGKDGVNLVWNTTLDVYLQSFVLNSGLVDDMQQALDNAWAAANDTQKKRIRYIKDTFETNIESSKLVENEDASAIKTDAGKDAVLSTFDFSDSIWANAPVLDNFYVGATKRAVDGASVKVRLLWDDDYLYVGYENFDNNIANLTTTDQLTSTGNWWAANSDDVETYLSTELGGNYYAYFGNPSALNFRYLYRGQGYEFDNTQIDWNTSTKIFDENGVDNDRWVIIQAISFESLGITEPVTTATDLYGYFYRGYYDTNGQFYNIGWNGASTWTSLYLRQIILKDGSEELIDKQALQQLYNENKDKPNNGYTQESWNIFQQALASAKAVLEDDTATQQQVNDTKTALESAISQLVEITGDYTITATAHQGGNISPAGVNWVTKNTNAVFTITPEEGYRIEKILVNGRRILFPKNEYTFYNVRKDQSIEVFFEAIASYTITATAHQGGNISPAGEVKIYEKENAVFTITPEEGYRIEKILVNGRQILFPKNEYTFYNVRKDQSIEVFFKAV